MFVQAYTLNAFAKTDEGGNPAGVVLPPDSIDLTEEQMKKIAAIIGFSETAFVTPSDHADYKVRFFTPTEEVDLCGHATIGTFSLMHHIELIGSGEYTQETKAGILGVSVYDDSAVLMEQALPKYFEIVDKKAVAQSLGLPLEYMHPDLPVQVVSTGLKDLMVPVKDMAALKAIVADDDAISAISKQYDATGYHVFTLETLYDATAHCRNFAPLFGIPEESATGTSNGALGCYLYHHGVVSEEQAEQMVMEQGYTMGQPSEIRTSLFIDNGQVSAVRVGGHALNLAMREIKI